MSYIAGLVVLHELWRDGLGLAVVILGAPRGIEDTPYLFSEFERCESVSLERVKECTYRTTHTLLLSLEDPEQAELALAAYVNRIPAVVDRDRTLAGAVRECEIAIGEADYTTVGEGEGAVEYRSIRFTSEIIEYVPYGA